MKDLATVLFAHAPPGADCAVNFKRARRLRVVKLLRGTLQLVMLPRPVPVGPATTKEGWSNVVVDPSHVTLDPLAVHGRGLQIVDACSTRWGSELDAVGMTVWFVLEPA